MWRSNYAPILHRAERWMGLQPRLPHYDSLLRVILSSGIWFAVIWFTIMWFLEWRTAGVPLANAMGSAAMAGLFFGLAMAGFYAWGRRKWKLSRWEDL